MEAADLLDISYRQCGRRWASYKEKGAAGLVHGLRGRSSNRKISEDVRAVVTELYRSRYEGFGPVLFTEKLHEDHQIDVDHETARRLLIAKRPTIFSDGGTFDEGLNEHFSVAPREKADFHRPADEYDLAGRTLSANWTLSFENRLYQITTASANYSPASRKVQIGRYLDGQLHMFYRGREVDFKEFSPPEKKPSGKGLPLGVVKPSPPAADHPWRRYPGSDAARL